MAAVVVALGIRVVIDDVVVVVVVALLLGIRVVIDDVVVVVVIVVGYSSTSSNSQDDNRLSTPL